MGMQQIGPVHPGERQAEYLEELGVTQYRLARYISVHPRRIDQIVKGERGISADTALRLARYFGTSAEFWMNLQDRYELETTLADLGDRLGTEVKRRVA